jgi:tricorn protease
MRYPTTSATEVAFVARGGLWTVPLAGGRATRLPLDPGQVVAPRFSPDGRWIAFTRWASGARDVYVVPSGGGAARRLTFDGDGGPGDDLVLAWTPDGSSVVFLSSHGSPSPRLYQAFAVPLGGGQPRRLPLDRAGQMSFSPGGEAIVFNRIFRNFELRKRYLGGQHQNLFTYDFASKRLRRLTDWKGTDTTPMWAGRKVYFLSDRGAAFRQNIWVYDLNTRATRQVTSLSDYDVDWPSLGAGGIVFQQGGKLYRLDLPSERCGGLREPVQSESQVASPACHRQPQGI